MYPCLSTLTIYLSVHTVRLCSDIEGKFVGLERAVLDTVTRSVGINTAYELQKYCSCIG